MKGLRHVRPCARRRINADGHDERLIPSHPVAPLIGKVPLEPEVPLATRRRVCRYDGNEERAGADLATDLLVPNVSAPELTLVEPNLNARGPQCLAKLLGRLRVLRGIAQEHRSHRCARRLRRLSPHPRLWILCGSGECPEQPLSGNSAKRTSAFHQLNGR